MISRGSTTVGTRAHGLRCHPRSHGQQNTCCWECNVRSPSLDCARKEQQVCKPPLGGVCGRAWAQGAGVLRRRWVVLVGAVRSGVARAPQRRFLLAHAAFGVQRRVRRRPAARPRLQRLPGQVRGQEAQGARRGGPGACRGAGLAALPGLRRQTDRLSGEGHPAQTGGQMHGLRKATLHGQADSLGKDVFARTLCVAPWESAPASPGGRAQPQGERIGCQPAA
jgi:hypothetical protein